MEGEVWWVSMLGFFMEESMGFDYVFLEPVELLVLHCFIPRSLNDPLLTKPP